MAAALRYAARRLGGRVLQRQQQQIHMAAVEDNQGVRAVWPTTSRRSVPSASSGDATASSSTKHAFAKSAAEPVDRKSKEYLASVQAQLKKIDNKKEELFRLIAKLDSQFPSHCDRNNRQLLMDLSVYVQPKPNDPQWAFLSKSKKIKRILGSWVDAIHDLSVPCQ
ncbi:hypothetical protein ACP70R_012598 [Stipagrostis hirtigluma subsp. patula]